MQNKVKFSEGTDAVVTKAGKIDTGNDEFYAEYTKFFSIIDGELICNWKGEDADKFYQETKSIKPFFEQMNEIISEYSVCFRNSANAHKSRMEESKSKAASMGTIFD